MHTFTVGKQHVIIRARAEDTGGVSSILELHHPPDTGPPLHVHQFEDEGFFILGEATASPFSLRRSKLKRWDPVTS
jgi:hypothetical protein